MRKFGNKNVEDKFKLYPPRFRKKLLFLRKLIFDLADGTPEIGNLKEELKCGEPSYSPVKTKIGSPIRINSKKTVISTLYILTASLN